MAPSAAASTSGAIAAIAWLGAEYLSGRPISNVFVFTWNVCVRLRCAVVA